MWNNSFAANALVFIASTPPICTQRLCCAIMCCCLFFSSSIVDDHFCWKSVQSMQKLININEQNRLPKFTFLASTKTPSVQMHFLGYGIRIDMGPCDTATIDWKICELRWHQTVVSRKLNISHFCFFSFVCTCGLCFLCTINGILSFVYIYNAIYTACASMLVIIAGQFDGEVTRQKKNTNKCYIDFKCMSKWYKILLLYVP